MNLTELVLFGLLGGASPAGGRTAIYTTIAQAVQATIQGLGLDGIDADHVVLLEMPSDRASELPTNLAGDVDLPCVVVSAGPDNPFEAGTLNSTDDWSFPVLVTIVDKDNGSLAWSNQRRLWLEDVAFAFHNKALAGAPGVKKCLVTPKVVVDASLFRDANLAVAQLLVRAVYRRVRT